MKQNTGRDSGEQTRNTDRRARRRAFHVTLIHPCVGKRASGGSYMRTWKMEPLPPALISALLPPDVERSFYDDRFDTIPYEQPTDLVAISVETYTARRAYQIASEYRARGVPVVMGGYHATLCPDEVQRYADAVVIGEAEAVFAELIDDARHATLKRRYRAHTRPDPGSVAPDRSIFRGKKYLPIRLVEFARGCRFRCEFCAVQAFHNATQTHRRIEQVIEELQRVRRPGQLVFFIDDNITSDLATAKELMRALIPLKIRWVSQSSINVAFDDEALALMKRSGCQGVLVGFESLDTQTLKQMRKGFNAAHGGAPAAMANFHRHNLRIYGTFIFGYDQDTDATFEKTIAFAQDQGLFIAAFNHITPFPGTPLYTRLQEQGRLLFERWWLDERYRYGMVPFQPRQMSPEHLSARCLEARQRFYSWRSIGRRMTHPVNRRDPLMFLYFLAINALHQVDVGGRDGLPLGDERHRPELLEAV